MTAKEMITTLRICGNHPSMDDKSCVDCPFIDECATDMACARLMNEAANIIEELMKELALARAGAE